MSQYEQHFFMQKDFPIIFHLDFIGPKTVPYPHWHENIEFLYCICGKGEAVIDSHSVAFGKGDLVVVNSSRLHYIKTTESDALVYYCLIVSSALLEQFGLHAETVEFRDLVCSEEIQKRFELIISEMKEKKECFEAVVKGEIGAMTAQLKRDFSAGSRKPESGDAIKRGIEYLKKNFRETVSLDDVAQYAGFSRFYFSRHFKEMTGYTVTDYLNYLRCREADFLLRSSDKTVSDIASECGFDDVSYFTKVYKRYTGRLPSHVRKERKTE